MDKQEVLDKIGIAIADIEWTHDIGIAAALDVAMKRVKDWERLKIRLNHEKVGYPPSADEYKMILKFEKIMAEMENEDGEK